MITIIQTMNLPLIISDLRFIELSLHISLRHDVLPGTRIKYCSYDFIVETLRQKNNCFYRNA